MPFPYNLPGGPFHLAGFKYLCGAFEKSPALVRQNTGAVHFSLFDCCDLLKLVSVGSSPIVHDAPNRLEKTHVHPNDGDRYDSKSPSLLISSNRLNSSSRELTKQ